MRVEADLLQDLQDAFASLSNLTLLMVNPDGQLLTNPSGVNRFTRLLLEAENLFLQEQIQTVIARFPHIANPIVYDHVHPGLTCILAPVRRDEKMVGYVMAGVMIEEQKRELVLESLANRQLTGSVGIHDPTSWREALASISSTSVEEQQVLLQRIGNLAALLSAYLDGGQRPEQMRAFEVLREIVDVMDRLRDRLPLLLEKFLLIHEWMEFAGYAHKTDDDQLMISHIAGESVNKLIGTRFSVGEGFLGQAAVTGRFMHWSSISRDPRAFFFTKREISVEQLFCYPVKKGEEVTGLLFGGTGSRFPRGADVIELVHVIARLVGMHLNNSNDQEYMQLQMARLTALLEICQILNVTSDLKRVFLLLVDMSLNLVRGPFACVLLRQQDPATKVKVVARGLSPEQLREYSHDLADRYFSPHSGTRSSLKEFMLKETGWGVAVMEFPILFRDEMYGVVSVAVCHEKEVAEYQTLLSSLALMGGVSIGRILETEDFNTDWIVRLAHEAMGQWAEEEFRFTLQLKELAVSFGKTLSLSSKELRHLAHACLLVHYDTKFVKEFLPPQHAVTHLLEEYSNLTRKTDKHFMDVGFGGTGAQILALLTESFNQNQTEKQTEHMAGISDELHEKFRAFLIRQQVSEYEVSLMEPEPPFSLLTVREQDVLKLVIKGLSNREIAETLFISEHTVKNHMSNIFQKLGVTDRTQLIAKAYSQKPSFYNM